MLTKDQLNTFITETEAVINTRPLVYVDDDLGTNNAITPAQILSTIQTTGTPVIAYDDGDGDPDYKQNDENSTEQLIEIWKRVKNI